MLGSVHGPAQSSGCSAGWLKLSWRDASSGDAEKGFGTAQRGEDGAETSQRQFLPYPISHGHKKEPSWALASTALLFLRELNQR